MQTFQIKLNKIGEITVLPDSQRLFGFLMSLLDANEKEKIDELASDILTGKRICMISNIMPLGYYPMPKDYIMEKLKECLSANQEIINKLEENRKDIRKRVEDIEKLISIKDKEKKEEEYEKEKIKEEIKKMENIQANYLKSELKKSINIHTHNKVKIEQKIEKIKKEIKEKRNQIREQLQKYNSKTQQINLLSPKEIYESIKKMAFIQKQDLEKLLTDIGNLLRSDKKVFEVKKLEEYAYIKKSQNFIQKFHLESQTKKWPGLPNIAYSLPILSFQKQGKNNDGNSISFCFFVSIDQNCILFEKLENMSRKEKLSYPCFLGNKASSGYNAYEITEVVRIENSQSLNIKVKSKGIIPHERRRYLNLGMLLPNENKLDWQASTLEISSSDRKPYEINDETAKVISFITDGSVIVGKGEKDIQEQIGKCIRNQYNPLYKNAMIFGNSFFVELEG